MLEPRRGPGGVDLELQATRRVVEPKTPAALRIFFEEFTEMPGGRTRAPVRRFEAGDTAAFLIDKNRRVIAD